MKWPQQPGSATISIVPVPLLHEVRRLAFTSRQHARLPSCHISGGGSGAPYFPFFQKGVTASYQLTIIYKSTTEQDFRNDILLFIQFIFYMFIMLFDDTFVLMVHIFYLTTFLFIILLLFILCVYFYIIILEMILLI